MINLTQTFQKIGDRITKELQYNILQQRNLDGSPIMPVAQSTQIARAKKGFSTVTRLLLTGQFYRNAFKYIVQGNDLKLFGNPQGYPGSSVSYADIINLNDRESGQVNQKIKSNARPHIFPNSLQDLIQMKSWQQNIKDIELEVAKQANEQFKDISIQINIG